jgi:hypothetical protein
MRIRFSFGFLLWAALAYASIAMAQSPGTFTATGKMVIPRFLHTTTLLPGGSVLITGGGSSYGTDTAESSAELYDPASGTFIPTGSMSLPRARHTATLLPDGRVLIAGGGALTCCSGAVASAEVYDPASGTFVATGAMTVERAGHTATLLNDGKVLIAGGGRLVAGSGFLSLAGAELYDPVTGTFTATGDMHEPYCDTATLLQNGKVLITRSFFYDLETDTENFVRHAEIYDPWTGTFAFLGDTIAEHLGGTATLLQNGKVLLAGGGWESPSARAELYNPASGKFEATGNLTTGREQHAAALMPDGTVLFAGGHGNFSANPDNLASAEIYDPASGLFRAVGSMITGRDILGATLLSGGKVLIAGGNQYYPFGAGGRDPQHPEVAIAELYSAPILLPGPILFSLSADGKGQGAIWHSATGQIASPSSPAVAGEVLSVYTTSLAESGVIPPQVAIGSRFGEIRFFGNAPGYPGYYQVNVRVPSGVVPASAVPVRITYLGRPSNEVTIGVQ